MTDNTGGPAFPNFNLSATNGHLVPSGGMTLRDWFAGLAMQGIFSAEGTYTVEELAAFAYMCADEMLKARGGSSE